MDNDKGKTTTAIRVRGQAVEVDLLKFGGHELVITGHFPRTCEIKDEWYHDIDDVMTIIERLQATCVRADLFTFIDRPPVVSGHDFYKENDNVAAIELTTYDHWWAKQLNSAARGHVRKAVKSGVQVRLVPFDESLLHGIEEIFDETPMRQGKPFWHYRKGLKYLREIHQTFLERSDFLGAYFSDELVGFIKMVYAGETASLMAIIAKNAHRNKAVTNALIAKAVEVACSKGIRFLVYDKYDYPIGGSASLLLFKKNNAFVKLEYPRYFVPLTRTGRLVLKFGLQHGILRRLPSDKVKPILDARDNLRRRWYEHKFKSG